MKKFLFYTMGLVALASCQPAAEKTEPAAATPEAAATTPADLPYKAGYSSSWSSEVSDADLKMVLTTYKDWADGNMAGLAAAMGDSVYWDNTEGDSKHLSNAELMTTWKTYRDSLSAISISMHAFHKMYATDKKEGYIVTWYKEVDTYKSGKIDSAEFHDINQVKDGKITWYSQYKRPIKAK